MKISESVFSVATRYAKTNCKVKTSESRYLAGWFLSLSGEYKKLKSREEELSPETVEIAVPVDEMYSIRPATSKSGMTSASGKTLSELNDTLNELARVKLWTTYAPRIKGARGNIILFLKIDKIVSTLLQRNYDDGFRDGANLLSRLASGDATVSEYNASTEEGL